MAVWLWVLYIIQSPDMGSSSVQPAQQIHSKFNAAVTSCSVSLMHRVCSCDLKHLYQDLSPTLRWFYGESEYWAQNAAKTWVNTAKQSLKHIGNNSGCESAAGAAALPVQPV